MPQTVTAWAWTDGDGMRSAVLPVKDLFDRDARAAFLEPLLVGLGDADVLAGHNIRRFDLPVLQAEAMRVGLPLLKPTLVVDTIRLPRSKGFKKGLDNLAVLLDVLERKQEMNWQEWQDAYADPSGVQVRTRVESDVRIGMQVRVEMTRRGWLKAPSPWRP